MKIKLIINKSAMENAQDYFENAKKFKSKREGVVVAMKEMKERIEKLRREAEKEQVFLDEKSRLKEKRTRDWFEKFHHFFTSKSHVLVLAGNDAKQNDILFSKYLHGKNLFFHSHIKGAPATIVLQEEGQKQIDGEEKKEVAVFAASFSSAWKNGFATIDVYALESDKVSKYESGGFVGKGGFALKGEREWFKDTKLELFVSIDLEKEIPIILPFKTSNSITIRPGSEEKSKAAKKIAAKLKIDHKKATYFVESLIQILPGNCEVSMK